MFKPKDLAQFFEAILTVVQPEIVDTISQDAWQDRLLPLFAHMQEEQKFDRALCSFQGHNFWVVGHVQAFKKHVLYQDALPNQVAQGTLYFFDDFTDLSLLRRFKEYPDETGREQLESCWSAFCVLESTGILINPSRR